ncbi:MAG: hypothetical protein IJ347_03680 [Faecalibacterium sp.]|nr:hypothetical protein [Faecalibacterium sp.]
MFDPKEYAKGALAELEDGADGISGFVGTFCDVALFTDEEWEVLEHASERARGFADGFKCCLEMWPASMKGAADD